ncbi:MAG TPA: cyclase family protein [Myxococcaceae bacterium]|nr:cyclase family protein [Myxococcaceae bacterium]
METRAIFDFVVTFTNGGHLRGEGFRLDLPRPDASDAEIAALLVAHLGLLMVGGVELRNLRRIEEPHRGSRGIPRDVRSGRRLVELSHPIHHGLVTYPGLPAPEISEHLSREASAGKYAAGVTFQIGRISLVANTGTYLDSPWHRYADGVDLAGLPLGVLVDLDGVLLRATGTGRRAIDVLELAPLEVRGKAVLLQTGWDARFGTPGYGQDAPFLTGAGAAWLVEQGAALVGIDSINIDDMADGARPAHSRLLAAGIPIVEHLRGLDQLPASGFRFSAAPPRIQGLGTFPVRAYAVVDG